MAYERREYAGAAPATTLNGAISNSTTTITLTDGTGYPTGATGPFWIVVDPTLSTEEKIKCTSRSGNVITATGRGGANGDGTSAVSHTSGAVVKHVFTKTDADEANAHYADTTLDHHTQYSLVAGTRAFTGLTAIAAIAGSSAVGDAASAGTGNTLARANHVHGREAFATPSATSRPGDAAGAGSATTVPHSDHAHAREAFGTNTVAADQTRSTPGGTYGDLATVGPTVPSLTTGTAALVILQATMYSSTVGEVANMSFTVSGATTLAASDTRRLTYTVPIASAQLGACAAIPVTLTAGSNTFAAKYATGAGNTVHFLDRSLTVIPLN